MKKTLILFFVLMLGYTVSAQEINSQVTIDAKQTGKTQLSVFKTLQRSLEDFINKTSWSRRDLPKGQRVNCSFFITITSYSSNVFKGSLQMQSSRPVFGSAMTTPIFNFKDDDFDFSYTEHQPFNFNPNSFESNLVSIISFYVYTILGLDADTFAPNGGADYFEQADQIASIAQQSNRSGWKASSGNNSRFELNKQLLSSNYSDYHQALYVYHRQGLDVMHDDVKAGKEGIADAIKLLNNVNRRRPNTLLIRSFFDAKANEVSTIFSGGPSIDIKAVVNDLNAMAPTFSKNWSSIKY